MRGVGDNGDSDGDEGGGYQCASNIYGDGTEWRVVFMMRVMRVVRIDVMMMVMRILITLRGVSCNG